MSAVPLPHLPHDPQDARVSTTKMSTSYFGTGMVWGRPDNRTWVRAAIRDHLRVAQSREERHRVAYVWKHIHYLARGRYPFRETTIINYYLDLPGWRHTPHEANIPAACASLRYCVLGVPWREMGCEHPMDVMELARNFVADDVREIRDFSPAILREIVRRMQRMDDWNWNNARLQNPVRTPPRWLVTYSDPAVGHDGGLYRGAGAQFICESVGGKHLWGWRLS